VRAPTVCRHPVSGSISLPSSGCFSPFPHGTCALSVGKEYLGLEGGPPMFRQDCTCPALLESPTNVTCTGLSPAMAQLSRRFQLVSLEHWPSPRSLATTSGVSVDVLSSGYLDVSVPRVCLCSPMYASAKFQISKVGFPIRKSSDQSLFAAPRRLSQRTTSFIASYRQGIHQMPLSHLIALISNAHC
jgi:hypothetical protein